MKPLENIKILDLSSYIAGPYSTLLLSMLGATVVKVESPKGDDSRTWPPIRDGFSGYFANFNGGKKSFALDLKDPESRPVLDRLISKCDVFLHNFTGRTRRKLNMEYEAIAAVNPNVIYCNVSGFGADGPYGDRKGFDTIFQAVSGVTNLTGVKGGDPIKCGVPIGDVSGGVFTALSIMAALYQRQLTGKGEYIDLSLTDCLVNFLPVAMAFYSFNGVTPKRMGSEHPGRVPSSTFLCGDGRFVQISVTDGQWPRLCGILGLDDWGEHEFYKLNINRIQAREEVMARLGAQIKQKDSRALEKECMEAGIPCGVVNDIEGLIGDPQIQYRRTIDSEQFGEVLMRFANFPARFHGIDTGISRRVPGVGEHNEEVLRTWLSE